MSGFFVTFIALVVAMAWSQWLTGRLPWAPRVVWAFGAVWVLTLVVAAMSLASSTGDIQSQGQSLRRVHRAAALGQYIALGSLVTMVPLTVFALLRPPVTPPRTGSDEA